MVKVILDPNNEDHYRYRIDVDGKVAGYVGHTYRMEQGWYFRNDNFNVYGTVRTQRLAIINLLSVPVIVSHVGRA